MGYLFRYLHILIFASATMALAVFVAADPVRTRGILEPVVEDAIEIRRMAVASYQLVSRIDIKRSSGEAVRLYAFALQMPSMLFDRLANNLEMANRQLDRVVGPQHGIKTGRQKTPREILTNLKRYQNRI